jgi:hypothetical protein
MATGRSHASGNRIASLPQDEARADSDRNRADRTSFRRKLEKLKKANCFPAGRALGWWCSRDSPFLSSTPACTRIMGAFHALRNVVMHLGPLYMGFYSLTLAPFRGYSSSNPMFGPVPSKTIRRRKAVGRTCLVNRGFIWLGLDCFESSRPMASPAMHFCGKARIRCFVRLTGRRRIRCSN